jgi:hypothetical protein
MITAMVGDLVLLPAILALYAAPAPNEVAAKAAMNSSPTPAGATVAKNQ